MQLELWLTPYTHRAVFAPRNTLMAVSAEVNAVNVVSVAFEHKLQKWKKQNIQHLCTKKRHDVQK